MSPPEQLEPCPFDCPSRRFSLDTGWYCSKHDARLSRSQLLAIPYRCTPCLTTAPTIDTLATTGRPHVLWRTPRPTDPPLTMEPIENDQTYDPPRLSNRYHGPGPQPLSDTVP